MFKADKIGQNDGQFTLTLFTLYKPYIIPGLLPSGFNDFLFFFSSHTVRLNKFFENLINLFVLVDSKIQ